MTWLTRRRALVIGAGRSGRAAARLLAARGASVRVVERSERPADDPGWPEGVVVRYGDDRDESLEGISLVVPSPGVAREHALLRAAVARRLAVWSEIELAARFLDCPILAITGTNGKSTTTTLLGAMLAADGHRVFVGGNLGTPLSDAAVDDKPYAAAVVEVSSFQLEWVERFRPNVAVLLNLTPDHQDRYADPAEYAAAKARLLARRDRVRRRSPTRASRASVISFELDGNDVVVFGTREPRRYSLSESPLRGDHNRENIQAAVTAATAWGVSGVAIRSALRSTKALPHRLELVRELGGVSFFDDSKATNVGAVEKSLQSFAGGVVLLLGGYDKGGDFATLRPLVRERVARLICFGKAGADIARQLEGQAACDVVAGLSTAVAAAARCAQPGQSVVLAPGCASFDEFTDYADRGRRFRAAVEAL